MMINWCGTDRSKPIFTSIHLICGHFEFSVTHRILCCWWMIEWVQSCWFDTKHRQHRFTCGQQFGAHFNRLSTKITFMCCFVKRARFVVVAIVLLVCGFFSGEVHELAAYLYFAKSILAWLLSVEWQKCTTDLRATFLIRSKWLYSFLSNKRYELRLRAMPYSLGEYLHSAWSCCLTV